MALYADAHEGRTPPDLLTLVSENHITMGSMACKEGRKRRPDWYVANPALMGRISPDTAYSDLSQVPWVWDREPVHKVGQDVRNVLFLDWHVAVCTEEEFRRLLETKPSHP